jgi:hypothetical protein
MYVVDITGFSKNMGTTISGMSAQYCGKALLSDLRTAYLQGHVNRELPRGLYADSGHEPVWIESGLPSEINRASRFKYLMINVFRTQ